MRREIPATVYTNVIKDNKLNIELDTKLKQFLYFRIYSNGKTYQPFLGNLSQLIYCFGLKYDKETIDTINWLIKNKFIGKRALKLNEKVNLLKKYNELKPDTYCYFAYNIGQLKGEKIYIYPQEAYELDNKIQLW